VRSQRRSPGAESALDLPTVDLTGTIVIMSRTNDDDSFFVQERDRLASEVTSGFEELLSLTNVLNRQVEEVFSMSAEYETVANLWNSFHQIVQDQDETPNSTQPAETEDGRTTPLPTGLPGTGTHVVTGQIRENS